MNPYGPRFVLIDGGKVLLTEISSSDIRLLGYDKYDICMLIKRRLSRSGSGQLHLTTTYLQLVRFGTWISTSKLAVPALKKWCSPLFIVTETCEKNLTCCHTETEIADPTCYHATSLYTNSRLSCPSTDYKKQRLVGSHQKVSVCVCVCVCVCVWLV